MNPKIKIIQIVKGLDIGGISGGSERFGMTLIQFLDQSLFDKVLFSFLRTDSASEIAAVEQLKENGVRVFFLTKNGLQQNLFSMLIAFWQAWKILNTAKADILHSHFQVGTILAILLKGLGCTKYIMRTAHISKEWGDGPLAFLMRLLFSHWLFPLLVDYQVCVSESICAQIQRYPGTRLGRRTPKIIYNAINIEKFAHAQSLPAHLADHPICIGSIGRLVLRKGYKVLLQAIPMVLAKWPAAKFVLVGEGEDHEELTRFANQLDLAENVFFLGQRDDVVDLLAGWDLFVLPSYNEGLPTVILESMAAGVPVIATNIPGIVELIKDQETGWLVTPGDAQAIARTILQVLDNPKSRKQVIQQAYDFVQIFAIQQIALQYQEIYLHLAAKKLKKGSTDEYFDC